MGQTRPLFVYFHMTNKAHILMHHFQTFLNHWQLEIFDLKIPIIEFQPRSDYPINCVTTVHDFILFPFIHLVRWLKPSEAYRVFVCLFRYVVSRVKPFRAISQKWLFYLNYVDIHDIPYLWAVRPNWAIYSQFGRISICLRALRWTFPRRVYNCF